MEIEPQPWLEETLERWNEGKLGPTWLTCPAWLLAICHFNCAGQGEACSGTRGRIVTSVEVDP